MIIAVMLASAGISGCNPNDGMHLFAGRTMGTTFQVKLMIDRGRSGPSLNRLRESIRSQLEAIDRAMSPYREDSELSRFNHHHSGAPFAVTRPTAEVFEIAGIVGELTEGALDITAGALVAAWGFGPAGGAATVPDATTLRELQKRVGYRAIEVDVGAGSLRKKRPDIVCDLSAIAKGYGVDRVARLLDEYGIDDYMVEVGGEVRTRGLNDKGMPWRIAIEKPGDRVGEIETVVPLTGYALATSGDYRNFFEYQGKRFSHIIDPRSGRPIQHRLASVSVIHDQCAFADAYATALLVMGPEAGMELAEKLGLMAVFIIRDSESGYVTVATKGFSAFLEKMNTRH